MSNASRTRPDAAFRAPAPRVRGTGSAHAGGAFAAACELLDRDRLVSDLAAMIEIPSVNPMDDEARPGCREREMAEYYLDRMSELGLEVGCREAAPGRPNVWGRLRGRGEGPCLMLSGHLDTVGTENYPDALRARVADGRVYGRGACDMKAGLAAYLETVRLLREMEQPLAGDLLVTGVADEEHLMIGSRDLGRHGPRADYVIIGEPSDMVICPAHKGQVTFKFQTVGKAVHSSQPEKGLNAIEAMAGVIQALRGYGAELLTRESHALCGHARACPGVIRGGAIVSTVPELCELEVDRRTLPDETAESVRGEYRRLLDAVAEAAPEFRYELVGPALDVAPLDTPMDNPVVTSVSRAYEAVSGHAPLISAFVGSTDAPNLGSPAVIFGPGGIAQAHTTNEFVEIDDVVRATRIYLLTALNLLSARS